MTKQKPPHQMPCPVPRAKKLGVTKSSFYWHFKNHNALLMAMLDAWQEMQTSSVIDNVEELAK